MVARRLAVHYSDSALRLAVASCSQSIGCAMNWTSLIGRMPGRRAKAAKRPVAEHGSIRLRDGRTLSVTITDLSSLGCKVQAGEMLPIGEIVDVNMVGRDTRKASIRWSVLDRTGLLFI